MTDDLSRRRLFGLAGASAAGVAGVGLVACTGDNSSPSLVMPAADTSSGPPFVSRPDLTPPKISIRRHGAPTDPRYIFLNAPYSGPGHGGSYILDQHGHFVWFGPNSASHRRMNFDVQTFRGKPVLTWFQGLVVQGYGKGELVIADSSYKILHIVRPAHGELADFHDFYVTPEGTALITIYRTHSGIDLSSRRGPKNGYVISGVAQEIDIATGNLVWEWDSLNHVPLAESHEFLTPGDGTKARAVQLLPYQLVLAHRRQHRRCAHLRAEHLVHLPCQAQQGRHGRLAAERQAVALQHGPRQPLLLAAPRPCVQRQPDHGVRQRREARPRRSTPGRSS